MNLIESLKPELEKLISEAKISLGQVKRVALDEAWKILQLTVANIIQKIEINGQNLAGKDKKTIAIELVSQFYDRVFLIVDIPFVPPLIEPIIHNSVKNILMILIGSTIDAMVTTFRITGVFNNK